MIASLDISRIGNDYFWYGDNGEPICHNTLATLFHLGRRRKITLELHDSPGPRRIAIRRSSRWHIVVEEDWEDEHLGPIEICPSALHLIRRMERRKTYYLGVGLP